MSASLETRVRENPFHVLALPTTATAQEVERAGQLWLAQLALGLASAQQYATPLGTHPRTPERVRQAVAELREPKRRLLHELWGALG